MDQASATITAFLIEEIDKVSKPFGTYDVVKSRVETDLKIASIVKRKEKLVRKIKKRFGVDIEIVGAPAEEEDEHGQGPMKLTQSLGEDKEEGAEEEEAKEEPTQDKKRKAKT